MCEGNLSRRWQQELTCQSLAAYASKGLTLSKLKKLQKNKLPILYPWDPTYYQWRNNYNRKFSFFPLGIILCKNERDAKQALKFCLRYQFEFRIRSQGHSYTGYSLTQQIVIDVSRMNKITLRKKHPEAQKCSDESKTWHKKVLPLTNDSKCQQFRINETLVKESLELLESLKNDQDQDQKEGSVSMSRIRATCLVEVSPGARLGNVAEFLSSEGLSIPIGSCISVGASGLTLGGGISPSLIRLGGMTCDHLYSAEILVVTKERRVRKLVVKGKYHPQYSVDDQDLLFALRGGGGGNFGLVTKLVYSPCLFRGALIFSFRFTWEHFDIVFDFWQKWAPHTFRQISSELLVRSPKFWEQPIELKGQVELLSRKEKPNQNESEIFESLKKGLKKEWAPILNLASETRIEFLPTFADCARFWGTTTQTYFTSTSIFWQQLLDYSDLNILKQAMENAPGELDYVEFDAMRGRVSDLPSDATAFPWRQSLFWSQLQGKTLDPTTLIHHETWVFNLYQELTKDKPLVAGYVNAPQDFLTFDNKYLSVYYGQNRFKLQDIKARYDPLNIFHFQQSIPVAQKK